MKKLNTNKHRTKKGFYEIYPKWFKDFARELIKEKKECEFKDETCRGRLTVAHIDQNPVNNDLSNLKVLCQSHHIRLDQPFHVFSMSKKTDNSHLIEKIELRLESLSFIKKSNINILEAYSGDGKIWKEVQKQTKKNLNILKIEVKDNKKGIYLKGDNAKFMPLFNFENYDIIDLDAYGVPYQQLKAIFQKQFKGIVHVTFIQSGMGSLPNGLLKDIGYTESMIKKCRTLFSKNGMEKMQNFLYQNNVRQITGYFIDRKNYFYFKNDDN